MKIATNKDWEKAKETIVRTEQDSIGDLVCRTKEKLREQGFTHYSYFGKPRELNK